MPSLGPRPKTNPSVNRFQYHVRVILEAIYAPDEVWGRSRLVNAHMRGLYPTLHFLYILVHDPAHVDQVVQLT